MQALEAITELRDVIDHFWNATKPGVTVMDVRSHLNHAQDHLRSAAMEPLERSVEDRFADYEEAKKRAMGAWRLSRYLAGYRLPDRVELAAREELVKYHLRQGRSLKSSIATASEAVVHFQEAYTCLAQLRDKLQPTDIDNRLYVLILSVIFLILTLAFGIVIGFVIHS